MRLVPGTRQVRSLDGRSLENYFPNKVHQQLIKAPGDREPGGLVRHLRPHLDGGGPSGQARRCAWRRRALILVARGSGP